MAIEVRPAKVEYSTTITTPEFRAEQMRIYQYADLLTHAVREATPRTRLGLTRYGTRSREVMRYGDFPISVGYARGIKNDINPTFGIRFGTSDKAASYHTPISEELRNLEERTRRDAKEVIAPVLFELASRQGISSETIEKAAALNTATTLVGNGERSVILPNPDTGQIIRVTARIPEGGNPDELLTVEKVREILTDDRYRDRLCEYPYQTATILVSEKGEITLPGIDEWQKNVAKEQAEQRELHLAEHRRKQIERVIKDIKDTGLYPSSEEYKTTKTTLLENLLKLSPGESERQERLLRDFDRDVVASSLTETFAIRNGNFADAASLMATMEVLEEGDFKAVHLLRLLRAVSLAMNVQVEKNMQAAPIMGENYFDILFAELTVGKAIGDLRPLIKDSRLKHSVAALIEDPSRRRDEGEVASVLSGLSEAGLSDIRDAVALTIQTFNAEDDSGVRMIEPDFRFNGEGIIIYSSFLMSLDDDQKEVVKSAMKKAVAKTFAMHHAAFKAQHPNIDVVVPQ